ncbi:hypothetical protein EVAR_99464_1 [Eumeta japonica]|uniref:Uncharacterized protein n=1 Tax=Eumeta variegata TaxID=151549 RepID=A0A4C1Z5W9_EUMVA|nr:hypothetical protein EVAR_99464_1 [Eumeta japonica]
MNETEALFEVSATQLTDEQKDRRIDRCRFMIEKLNRELDEIEMGPQGKHKFSNRKRASKSIHSVESSEPKERQLPQFPNTSRSAFFLDVAARTEGEPRTSVRVSGGQLKQLTRSARRQQSPQLLMSCVSAAAPRKQ